MTTTRSARRIRVTGAVQGVGFRPFVHRLAAELGLVGEVRNDAEGVAIHVEGDEHRIAELEARLIAEAPPLARVERREAADVEPTGRARFDIGASGPEGATAQPVSPDASTCDACLAEMRDPRDRRHRHPFVNCTDCGPRFTIVEGLPYDRPRTTMRVFEMCADCAREYSDPADRRFHAQPVACPSCGPTLRLDDAAGERLASGDDAVAAARRRLAEGAIVAVKGIGGFHLACDARNSAAVARLRARKGRDRKPFAVMARDLPTATALCAFGDDEERLLRSIARPIVLLPRRDGASLAEAVAPGRAELGVMLPYTSLHHLLLEPGEGVPDVLVMTSGNVSDEPIVTDGAGARTRLAHVADVFVDHDREIRTACDDSVVRVVDGRELPVRRSRGFAPFPVHMTVSGPPVTAAGAELKNTFCVARDGLAFLGPHVGDLANWETLQAFESSIARCEELFHAQPTALAHDLNSRYLATEWAVRRAAAEGLRTVAVQHHHAHVAACMVEHGLDPARPVIGIAFDGAGLGDDGAIWGGELLVTTLAGYERAAHLAYVPQPGADAAAREPWRMALSWLDAARVPWSPDLPSVAAARDTGRAVVRAQCRRRTFAPLTSSVGRLFDAVASIVGLRHVATFEGEAAMDLEVAAADGLHAPYEIPAGEGALDVRPLVRAVARDVRRGVPGGIVSARFHESIAALIARSSDAIRGRTGCDTVVLTGGVFQNARLLTRARALLSEQGFDVRSHHVVPPNDGGLALGQAAVATVLLAKEM